MVRHHDEHMAGKIPH